MSQTLIDISGLNKVFPTKTGDVHALSDVNLTIGKGEFVSLLGPSGCGKTTLLKILAGLEEHTSGEASISGAPITKPRGDVGVVFQKPTLLPWRNIEDNVLLPIELHGKVTPKDRVAASQLLTKVGLGEFSRKHPDELSGGMQQRAAICRALVHNPDVLLMDEPFGALDAMTRDALNVEVNRIWRDTAKTVVLITHSIPEAVFLSERVIVMGPRPGRIIDIIDIPFGKERNLELLGSSDFARICSGIRKYFEVTV
jgi:NitT/TauT family transport system ATP-binding protein